MPAQNHAGEPDKNKKFHEQFLLTSKARFGGLFFVQCVGYRQLSPLFCLSTLQPVR